MPDLQIAGLDLASIVAVITALLLPIQVIFYIKAQKMGVRLLPLLAVLLLMAGLFVKGAFFSSADDWENVAYLMLAISAAPLALACGIGVGIGVWLRHFLKKKVWGELQQGLDSEDEDDFPSDRGTKPPAAK